MKAFWSGTDLEAIDEYDDGDFSFALVINLKGEYKFRVSVWQPVEAHEDVELEIVRPAKCTKNMSKEVEDLCNKRISTYQRPKTNYTSYGYKSPDQGRYSQQERLPLYSSSEKMSFTDITDEVDDINSEAIEGTIDYKEYKIRIDDLNDTLKKKNSCYKVTLIAENQINNLLHMWPNQMIVYEADGKEVYDASFYGGYML